MTSSIAMTAESVPETAYKRVLLTGARSPCALELARQLAKCGHAVFAADTSTLHVARFSNAVKKFYGTPSPRFDTEGFIDKLVEIIEREKIDVVIPIWEEVMYLSQHLSRLPDTCEVVCAPFELIHTLHHKWHFIKLLQSLGIKTPRSVLLRDETDLDGFSFNVPYVLKRCYSRGSRFILKVTTPEPPSITIESGNPWIAQEFINGTKYCSFSVCHQGEVLAHAVYPVRYTIDGSSCVAFEAVEHTGILDWTRHLIRKIGYTGHIAFDFIVTPENELYAIECNPRATSGIHLFKPEDGLDRAYFHNATELVTPKPGNSQQIFAGMLLYGLRLGVKEKKFLSYLNKMLSTKDVVFSSSDLLPFFSEPLVLASYWARSRKLGISIPVLFTYDLDWDEDPE